jgi:hypothetical protein
MTTHRRPNYRPGHPDGAHPLAVLGVLGVLFGAGAAGWALLAGVAWLVWTYTLVTGSVIIALATVGGIAYLAVRGNWRARIIAGALAVALGAFVAWVVTR